MREERDCFLRGGLFDEEEAQDKTESQQRESSDPDFGGDKEGKAKAGEQAEEGDARVKTAFLGRKLERAEVGETVIDQDSKGAKRPRRADIAEQYKRSDQDADAPDGAVGAFGAFVDVGEGLGGFVIAGHRKKHARKSEQKIE